MSCASSTIWVSDDYLHYLAVNFAGTKAAYRRISKRSVEESNVDPAAVVHAAFWQSMKRIEGTLSDT